MVDFGLIRITATHDFSHFSLWLMIDSTISIKGSPSSVTTRQNLREVDLILNR